MATAMRYVGPEGQVNRDVGADTGEGDELTPGHVYEVSADLADRLADTASWERVNDFSHLGVKQLRELAVEREIEGASKLKKPGLIAALRARNDGASAEDALAAGEAADGGSS